MTTSETQEIQELCINSIRFLSADAVQHANSGHPGMPMGAAAMAYTLWTKFLRFNPKDPAWFDRDRFILSAGHGSMLLYSLLHLTGYDLPLDELKRFRQWGSKTPGHPERGHAPGVEVATGPLGQGFGNAVGMAIAEAWLAARFNRPGHTIIDHYTYGICGDGDLMEGISQEAASLAGHLQLGKLIFLYDHNHVSLAGGTDLTFTEDVGKRFESYGWHIRHVERGNDTEDIASAIEEARQQANRPSLLIVRTRIGYGSPAKQDSFEAHGSPLGEEELVAAKKALGWPSTEKFFLPEDAVRFFREVGDKGAEHQATWEARLAGYRTAFPAEAAELDRMISGKLPDDWRADLPAWSAQDKPLATRAAGGQVLNALAKRIPNLLGGSADLNPSTNTALKGQGNFQPAEAGGPAIQGAVDGVWGYAGRNLAFGVREHAMGAAVNGLAAHGGILPFSATFLIFSDYMKPSIRLGALSKLKVFYVFTHDSVAVGEDGPTHEPIEHLAGLRSMPGLNVLRPADATETAQAWAVAIEHDGPTLFALSRQNLPHLDRSRSVDADVSKGAYILSEAEGGRPDVILIGSGSEVSLCMKAQEKLASYGVSARVVSMPGWNLFAAQDDAYRERILPSALKKRVTVEAAATFGWARWAGDEGTVIGVDHFGASAPGAEIMKHFGLTAEHVTAAALALLNRPDEAKQEYGGGTTHAAPASPT
ncbi:transketolase [Paraburkholderia sp. BL10I2N1]|uniref:transketolase n=1 Tax=Paraburkholderia sp. BL10I2N1 TaxID=1938796 RepID=UPI00105C7F97|nr:transketolase [Paraburkholderia sp. BL10I2N1]TDN70165.1 transketolase [Paraburkholderia sp. BL10I2N1]